jgi:anti-sigma factor ChrR (cupin superfamily)
MTFEETKYLLPPYLAGSLTPEQRAAVQEALKIHPELRDELKFWNGILQATLLDLAEEGLHPISEQIVTYAEGTLHSGEERLTVEGHLQTCAPCCEELLLLKEPDQQEPAIRAARTDPKGLFFSRTIRVQLAWGSALRPSLSSLGST